MDAMITDKECEQIASKVVQIIREQNDISFAPGGVPVKAAARAFGKDDNWVRTGIVCGWLDIGIATRNGQRVSSIEQMDSKYGKINYFISPKKLYEATGFIYKPEKE